LIYSGARVGELAALQWGDINLDAGYIRIERSAQRQTGRGVVILEPKNETGRRNIFLPEIVLNVLREYRSEYLKYEFLRGKKWTDENWLFLQRY
jgi:integrase